MAYQSILFRPGAEVELGQSQTPGCLEDLNLDQVIDAVIVRKKAYQIKQVFYHPLTDKESIQYRQEVFLDLENKALMTILDAFAERMVDARHYKRLSEDLFYDQQKQGWFYEAVSTYWDAVSDLASDLSKITLRSRGLLNFRRYILNLVQTTKYKALKSEVRSLRQKLQGIHYNIIIKDNWVRVRKYDAELDYTKMVEKVFRKFKQREGKNYRFDLFKATGMNPVEAQILDCVVKLYPEVFDELNQFCKKYNDYEDMTICKFDTEIQFYLAYTEFMNNIKEAGLPFCYPQLNSKNKIIHANHTYDVALANKYRYEALPVICNNFYLKDQERILIISGPNQGGKTTFARMFGQVHYLASLGCPVPGKDAELFLFDHLFTHFEEEEDLKNLRGKLKDDLVRLHEIFGQATQNSIVIMNEIFTSTTLEDAIFLGKEIIEKIIRLDALCVCVTFIDELSTHSDQTVSMVSTIEPENPSLRTFKIIRKPADGQAHAMVIAKRHDLTYDLIKERIDS